MELHSFFASEKQDPYPIAISVTSKGHDLDPSSPTSLPSATQEQLAASTARVERNEVVDRLQRAVDGERGTVDWTERASGGFPEMAGVLQDASNAVEGAENLAGGVIVGV